MTIKIIKDNIIINNKILTIDIIKPPKIVFKKAKKTNNLEVFWHVFAIYKKHDIINEKTAVITLKARRAYRDSKTGEIKNIEKRMYGYNLVVFLESLDDLYPYDFSALRYKKRDLTLLKSTLNAIGVNAEEFLNQYYY